jgi:nucleotide-binding universal stress UspA family protein
MILDEAERWGADLIVVGSHGYRAWERFLLGSVSQAVVSHAKCSVEVVRCRPGNEVVKDQERR